MSKVVGHRWVRYGNSDETKVAVTCCEDAKWKIEELSETVRLLRALNTNLNPTMYGDMIIIHEDSKVRLNYCPVCGDKYKEAPRD